MLGFYNELVLCLSHTLFPHASNKLQIIAQGAQEELAKSKNKLSGIGAPWETAKELRSLEINAA